MRRMTLSDTLIALVSAIEPPEGSGLIVTEASMEVPLEIWSATAGERLTFFANPPHSRWVAGVLPATHLTRFEVALVEDAPLEQAQAREAKVGR